MQGKRASSLWHCNHHSGVAYQRSGMGPRNLTLSEPCKPSEFHSLCNLALGAVGGRAWCQSLSSPSATLPWI